MKMHRIFYSALAALLLCSVGAFAAEQAEVIARVGDAEITQQDVAEVVSQLPPQQAAFFNTPAGQEKVVEELINRELLFLWGEAEKVDTQEGFAEDLARLRSNLVRDYAVRSIIMDVSATDEDVKAFYEENQDKFATPEKVRARHILVENEEEAKKILQEIRDGKPFEDAAKEYSTCPSKEEGGELGFFVKGQMVPEFENAAFALEVGSMSDPVKSQFGWHIIEMEEKQPSSVVPLEEATAAIKTMLTQQKQQEAFYKKLEELRKEYPVEILKKTSEAPEKTEAPEVSEDAKAEDAKVSE
ncbi:MAG TPA: peptidylprolyl isomerase [Synergistaceae bacterium]|nr:peptidylprolyl isomerase [Synergistaceae bacterium]